MLDYRLTTFITLCDIMNYRKTANILNMTQPAVTQHVQYLEQHYSHKLFIYEDKVLRKTEFCEQLELYAKGIMHQQKQFIESAKSADMQRVLRVGATKSIGEFVIYERIKQLCKNGECKISFHIDNTAKLLAEINAMAIDIALIEGIFDKSKYSYHLIRKEELVGICSKGHNFSGKQVTIDELLTEHLILREQGSGSRAVFEDMLKRHNYSTKSCNRISEISTIRMIKELVCGEVGVSFVYKSTIAASDNLSTFTIKGGAMEHEFNYVYLKHTTAQVAIDMLSI
ncbi:MAG: LysR family transcriptional regulator [Bacillota bacterium]